MLSKEEKEYLFSKLEYTKKKKCIDSKNDIYEMLKGEKEIDIDGFIKILNSLEYSFRKKLKEGEINTTLIKSIKEKLPESWLGIKYSSLSAKKKKDEKLLKKENVLSFNNFIKLK